MVGWNRLSDYQFVLPEELIAQHPQEPRDASRLLHVDRASGEFELMEFRDLGDRLNAQDFLMFNNTRVIPARLNLKREGGGASELFVLEIGEDSWKVLLRPSAKVRPGKRLHAPEGVEVEPLTCEGDGIWQVRLHGLAAIGLEKQPLTFLDRWGSIPLPHYIRGGVAQARDKQDYQTLFASQPGSSAAPTAALHFTPSLIEKLDSQGVHRAQLTLHTGLGTFSPVRTENLDEHRMHEERFFIPESMKEAFQKASKEKWRRICVGTTTLRALESAYRQDEGLQLGMQQTRLFVRPGYQFRTLDSLITNFHLPGSTLLMLTSAFGGYELIMRAYRYAIEKRLRFFSYGDAMWIT